MININSPSGFKFLGKNIGIKRKNFDFAVACSDKICNAAAVFTKNSMCGVSIPIGKSNVSNGKLQAVVITSGMANVATGQKGSENAYEIISVLADKLKIDSNNIVPSSTGVIGRQLPIQLIIEKIKETNFNEDLKKENVDEFTRAIITTDKALKFKSVNVGDATILGVCKGSGMIEPNMATMLVYIFTDAIIESYDLNKILHESVNKSFNMISIDTDTSTSDSVITMASGYSKVDLKEFQTAYESLCIELAKMVVLDGEGATKLIEVNVKGAIDFEQAKQVAKSIVNSPLVKTAIYGADPNCWGRVIMAIGKVADSRITLENVSVCFDDYKIFDKGIINETMVDSIKDYLISAKSCVVNVDLGLGDESATVWGCDLTEEYIKINALYTT